MSLRGCRVRILVPWCAAVLLAGCAGALNLPPEHRPATYTVHRGDTLYSIAWHYGLDYHAVARWNGIPPPYTIYPGQRVRLYRGGGRPHGGAAGKKRVAAGTARPVPAAHASATPRRATMVAGGPVAWHWPAQGNVKSTFGQQGLVGKGIVIEGKLGQPVFAAAGGTVVYSGSALVGYGRLIIVKHNDEWLSAYAHNQRLLVREGDQVKAGQRIATMGEAPDEKPGLYFEIRHDGEPVNPLRFLPKQG